MPLKNVTAPLDRTRLLLEGPILPTLIRLAAPTVGLMTFQAVVHSAEGYFVGFLGSNSLAGISLSFPFVMLMTTMSAGAFGGGVAGAIARALGAGQTAAAGRICGTAIWLATLFGAASTAVMLVFGRSIFSALGAVDGALDAAVEYSHIFFLGAIPFWQFQAAASCFRGSGNTSYPAVVGAIGGVLTLVLSPPLIFGWGPLPAFGLAGAAWAVVAYNIVSAIALLGALRTNSSLPMRGWTSVWPERHVAWSILRVAIPSAANTLQSNLTFLALTALVAPFGTSAIAGYGMSGRLEFLLIPVVFGVGSALIPLVATNLAAGNVERARQATRAGLFLGLAAGAIVGVTGAVFPEGWLILFTTDTAVTDVGARYLRIVGPFYFAFGGGLVLFFAAQGRGRVVMPLFAGLTRLIVAALGGYVVTRHIGIGLDALFWSMSAGLFVYGSVMLWVTRKQLW